MLNAEMPYPRAKPVLEQLRQYKALMSPLNLQARKEGEDFDTYYIKNIRPLFERFNQRQGVSWDNKKAKAFYFGDLTSIRHIFFDVALRRNDIFDVMWSRNDPVGPWNPESPEKIMPIDPDDAFFKSSPRLNASGYIENLLRSRNPPDRTVTIKASDYKYVVVLLGLNGDVCSDDLNTLLFESGSVILLQDSTCKYHFSSRLKPWVHYVPIMHNAADVARKVDWLIAHNDMAKQIADNGYNFGRSFLRLEDSVCYIANALDTVGNLLKDSNVTRPFFPVKVRETSIA